MLSRRPFVNLTDGPLRILFYDYHLEGRRASLFNSYMGPWSLAWPFFFFLVLVRLLCQLIVDHVIFSLCISGPLSASWSCYYAGLSLYRGLFSAYLLSTSGSGVIWRVVTLKLWLGVYKRFRRRRSEGFWLACFSLRFSMPFCPLLRVTWTLLGPSCPSTFGLSHIIRISGSIRTFNTQLKPQLFRRDFLAE